MNHLESINQRIIKMKKIILLLSVITLFLFSASCSNDDHATDSRPPVFGELKLSPSTVQAGDSVTATVSYNYPGKKIYKNEYTLTVSGNTSNGHYEKSWKWEVIDPTKSEPTCKFASPDEAGTYTVSFRASRINYSSGGPNGELYGSANSVSSVLYVKGGNKD
jgi:hypothetical protein